MSASKRGKRLIKPLFFISLIGGEYKLLLHSDESVMRKHYLASVFLVLILLISSVSIFYATDLLFHIWQVEVVLALFISLLFAFIYIFLLSTFSKAVGNTKRFSSSNLIRAGFVVFMAFLISKPIEVLCFSKPLKTEVAAYKSKLILKYSSLLDSISNSDLSALETEKNILESRGKGYISNSDQSSITDITNTIAKLNQNKSQHLAIANRRIDHSDFLLFQIKSVSTRPLSWLICLLVVLLFLVPGYLIYSISSDENYYALKKTAERDLILHEYNEFIEKYKAIFERLWGEKVKIYTRFADPPFNSIRLTDSTPLSNEDFIKKYLK